MSTEEHTRTALDVLARSPHHRILTRVSDPPVNTELPTANTRTAAIISIETTGLDPITDEIIQLNVYPFTYTLETNELTHAGPLETQYQQPRSELGIPPQITHLTGLDDHMVAGAEFELDKFNNIITASDLLIAHNAAFARPFLERLLQVTQEKPWACLKEDVPWFDEGITSPNLLTLSMLNSVFYDRHDNHAKAQAVLHILTQNLPLSGEPTLSTLRRNASQPTYRLIHDIPNHADDFRSRGYKHSRGDLPHLPKGWWKDTPERHYEAETTWLTQTIYKDSPHVTFTPIKYTALERYSDRPIIPESTITVQNAS